MPTSSTVNGGNRISFVDYSGNSPVERPAERRPVNPIAPPEQPGVSTRVGQHLDGVAEKAGASKVVTSTEIAAILKKLDGVKTTAELADAFIVCNKLVDNNLMALESRAALGQKLYEKAASIEGGFNVIPLAVTEAVGEDIFGMGALELGKVAERVLTVSRDNVVSPTETKRLVGLLAEVSDRFELFAAYNALRFMVQGNSITTADRSALASAYSEACQRVGDGFQPVTRSLDEDVFGGGRLSGAADLVAKGIADGGLQAAEVRNLVSEIGNLYRPDQLAEVYFALGNALGEREGGGRIIDPRYRTKLASAVLEADQRMGGGNLPVGATIQIVGEDIFGTGNVPLMKPEARLLSAIADNVVAQQEAASLVKDIKGVRDAESFSKIFAVVKQTLALNIIGQADRESIKDAISAKGNDLNVHFPVTRGLYEDILGFYPPV